MSVRAFWLRVVVGTAVAFASLAEFDPPHPSVHVDAPASAVLGVGAGTALALLVVRRRPRRGRSASVGIRLARHGFIGLWAANEELVWRRVVLGECLTAGGLAALAVSALGFALAHRAVGIHLATGTLFGGLYLGTGALAASIAGHWSYNAVVAAAPASRIEPAASGSEP